VYIGHDTGVNILDITNPSTPLLLGVIETENYPVFIKAIDSVLYISVQGAGVKMMDISSPASPTLIGTIEPASTARDIAVNQSAAFIVYHELNASFPKGFQIFDLTQPSTPILRSTTMLAREPYGISIKNNIAYIAGGLDGVLAFDVTIKELPDFLGALNTDGTANDIEIISAFAYVSDLNGHLKAFTINDPANMKLVETYEDAPRPTKVVTQDNLLYISDLYAGLIVLNPDLPTRVSSITNFPAPTLTRDLAVDGDLACLVTDYWDLLIYDLTANSTSPLLAEQAMTPGTVYGSDVDGNIAYITSSASDLEVFDFSDPTNPILLGTMSSDAPMYSIDVVDNIAYIAGGTNGLRVVDVSDHANPQLIADPPPTGNSFFVKASGTRVYVCDVFSGVQVFDASDPSAPQLLGSFSYNPPLGGSIAVEGTIAYLPDLENKLLIVNFDDPTSPTIVGELQTTSRPKGIQVIDQTAYLTTTDGFSILDVSDPIQPTLLGYFETPIYTIDSFAVQDQIAYTSNRYQFGFQMFDVSNPQDPRYIGSYNQILSPESVTIFDTFALVQSQSRVFHFIDITDCPPCPADLTNDNTLNFFDISAFLQAFTSQDPIADFTNDALFDFFDVSAFLAAFAAGCP